MEKSHLNNCLEKTAMLMRECLMEALLTNWYGQPYHSIYVKFCAMKIQKQAHTLLPSI